VEFQSSVDKLTWDLAVRRRVATPPSSVLFSWERGKSWEDRAKGKRAVMMGPRPTGCNSVLQV
jgi:hypothetical protein